MLTGAEKDPALASALAIEFAPFLSAVAAAHPPVPDDLRHAAAAGDWHRVAAATGLRARLGAG